MVSIEISSIKARGRLSAAILTVLLGIGALGLISFAEEPPPPPANDNRADATAIAALPANIAQSTESATKEFGEPAPCGDIASTVWYSYTPAADELVSANTSGSDFDTVIAVYNPEDFVDVPDLGMVFTGDAIDCNDNAASSLQSKVFFPAESGVTYLLQVGGSQGFQGNLSLNVSTFARPANDDTADAISIAALPYTNTQDTDGASLEEEEESPCGDIGATVWYSYTPTTTQTVTADSFGSNLDTVIAVYESDEEGLTSVACNDAAGGGTPPQAQIAFTAGGDKTYLFQVGGRGGAVGSLTFNVKTFARPANDNLVDAIQISAVPYDNSQTTEWATLQASSVETRPCGNIGATVWYSYTPDENQLITADTFGSNFNTVLAVFRVVPPSPNTVEVTVLGSNSAGAGGTNQSRTLVTCNDNAPGSLQSQIFFPATGGTTYVFQVGGAAASASAPAAIGNLELSVQEYGPPANDSRTSAKKIDELAFNDALNTLGTTTESGETRPCGSIGSTVWYSYTPADDELVTANTLGSDFNTVLAVYRVVPAQSLIEVKASGQRVLNVNRTEESRPLVVCNDNTTTSSQSEVFFRATGGTTYLFQVGGWAPAATSPGLQGNLMFNVDNFDLPANDNFADATAISSLPYANVQSTQGATNEAGEDLSCGVGSTVWYSYTNNGATSEEITADTSGSDFDAVLAVYKITDGQPEQIGCDSTQGSNVTVTFDAEPGETYYFQVGGWLGAKGNLSFNVAAAS